MLLLSGKPEDRDRARHLLTSVLTRGRGEYIFRIGSFPPHASLFLGELSEEGQGVYGLPRTIEDLDSIRNTVTEIVDELGGKVCLPYISSIYYYIG